MKQPPLRIGTRGSPLALAQAEELRQRLSRLDPWWAAEGRTEIVVIKTTGDRVQDRSLSEIGGKGLFTKEIEEALFERRIDVAVHSMKDMPTLLPEGLVIPVIFPREDPRDAFFSRDPVRTLADLPPGSRVGTSSLRRQAQVLAARPDLEVLPLRGNVETRLRKLAEGQIDATLLAAAGLKRLGRELPTLLSPEEMLPAVAQGAIGLEVRLDDTSTQALLESLNDSLSFARVAAERACLAVLEGSCRTPIAALAERTSDSVLGLRALVARPDGGEVYRVDLEGPLANPEDLGRQAGEALRAQLPAGFIELLTV